MEKEKIKLTENEEFEQNFKIGKVEEKQENEIRRLIEKYKEICAISSTKLGKTNVVKHKINTGDHEPIAQKQFRADKKRTIIIKEEVDKMLKDGIIKKSEGPWSSPVVIVTKKDGSAIFCIDYRKVNNITITDAHPLPRIDDLLEQFREAKWFSSIDLASGYWQIEMDEKDREKTAFTCHLGLFEFNVMPFGLKNAPPTFQRMMNEILKDWLDEFVAVYIDDIMIYSKTFEEHLGHIEKILKKLKEVNLMLKLSKCKWGERNIEFLGHVVGNDGLKPDPRKIDKIKNLPIPTTQKGVRSVLGLCGYYRKFVRGFSKIAKPLNELLKKGKQFEWTESQQKAFEELKEKLIQYPILSYPDYEKEFILITDASGRGLGAVLSQLNDDGKKVVIAYASRSLVQAEKNYPITDQECLAIMWAIEHFHKYLIGKKFMIITDHSALKTLNSLAAEKVAKERITNTLVIVQKDFIKTEEFRHKTIQKKTKFERWLDKQIEQIEIWKENRSEKHKKEIMTKHEVITTKDKNWTYIKMINKQIEGNRMKKIKKEEKNKKKKVKKK